MTQPNLLLFFKSSRWKIFFQALLILIPFLTLARGEQKSPSPTPSSQTDSSKKASQKKDPQVIIYSADFCSYCKSAKEIFDAKNIKYEIIDVQGKRHLIDEMEKKTGKRTVPQIIINGKHIGSYMSLLGANMTGELDDLLKVKTPDNTPDNTPEKSQ